jgi:hypothetical protein
MAQPDPDFLARAARFGHSAELLRAGHQITSTIHVPSLEALRQLFDDGSDRPARAALAAHLVGHVQATDPATDASEGAIMRRVQGYLYGNDALSHHDLARVQNLFPLAVTVISAIDKPIADEWVIDSPSPVVLNIGTLTMSERACITVRSTVLHLTMDALTRTSTPPPGRSDFNILGKTGATGSVGPEVGLGGQGAGGSRGTCSSPGIAGNPGGRGGTGTTGPTGSPGGSGGDGIPSMAAVITILRTITTTAPLSVFTQSGAGGAGGPGGTGGRGGTGGTGGPGESCGCEGTNGGPGGSGGAGGIGGVGGPGGSGVPAAGNVLIRVPAGQVSSFLQPFTRLPAPWGAGGAGGTGGSGGPGGSGGSAGKHSCRGLTGGRGADAARGGEGPHGQATGEPALVNIAQI